VVEMIKEGSGRHFDHKVVEVFLRVMKQKEERAPEGAMAPAPECSTPELRASGPRDKEFA